MRRSKCFVDLLAEVGGLRKQTYGGLSLKVGCRGIVGLLGRARALGADKVVENTRVLARVRAGLRFKLLG